MCELVLVDFLLNGFAWIRCHTFRSTLFLVNRFGVFCLHVSTTCTKLENQSSYLETD